MAFLPQLLDSRSAEAARVGKDQPALTPPVCGRLRRRGFFHAGW